MFRLRRQDQLEPSDLLTSHLFDQDTFYEAFLRDMRHCQRELIIESPFISAKRMDILMPVFRELRKRSVKIIINTRRPEEHDILYQFQAEEAIYDMQAVGVKVLYTGGHHRKVVILDRCILWEGSLNVLSQNDSCEMMRRISSQTLAQQMIDFLNIQQYLVQ